MTRVALCLVLAVVACGGSSKSTPSNTTPTSSSEQSLGPALTQLCAAPTRTKADPAWKEDSDQKSQLLGKHMEEGITNPKVIAFVDKAKAGNVVGTADLDALLTEATMKPDDCELRAVWKLSTMSSQPAQP